MRKFLAPQNTRERKKTPPRNQNQNQVKSRIHMTSITPFNGCSEGERNRTALFPVHLIRADVSDDKIGSGSLVHEREKKAPKPDGNPRKVLKHMCFLSLECPIR